jgi:uncharacterized surface protein with fasciclin (FAS1) repeats
MHFLFSLKDKQNILKWDRFNDITCRTKNEIANRLNNYQKVMLIRLKTIQHSKNKTMKTQKSLLIVGLFALITIFAASCGDGGKAAREKAKMDSTRMADSVAMVQKQIADSIAALPKSIAETAINTPNLSTLVAALTAAELVDVMKGTDALTVFAPTNDAFAAIQSTVDMLLKPENKSKLQNVLKYHVVAGTVKAADLSDGQEITTLQGEKLKVTIKDGKVMIGGAEVTNADVAVNNGVVHMVNKVLVPKKM